MPMTFTRVLGRVLGGHLTDMGAVIEIDCEVLAWDYRTVTTRSGALPTRNKDRRTGYPRGHNAGLGQARHDFGAVYVALVAPWAAPTWTQGTSPI